MDEIETAEADVAVQRTFAPDGHQFVQQTLGVLVSALGPKDMDVLVERAMRAGDMSFPDWLARQRGDLRDHIGLAVLGVFASESDSRDRVLDAQFGGMWLPRKRSAARRSDAERGG